MRRALQVLGSTLALTTAIAGTSAHAQMAVIDLKAILQAEQQVSQGLTQIQRLESQLSNQALMLQKTQSNVTGPITAITAQAMQILQQAQGLGYSSQNVAQQYAALYPTTMTGASLAATQASLAAWRQANVLALQQAMQMQNQVAQGQATTTIQVSGAVAASQSAAGQTAAIQSTNQLLAAVTAQLSQLQGLLITQARAEQSIAAQTQAAQAAGLADSQRLWAMPTTTSRLLNPGRL